MHPVFEISVDDIKKLNDVQARELIARLCKAELREKGVSAAAVHWGGDQRAKDGGVDVRVSAEASLSIGGFIKRSQCVFQVKAEQFGPSKISSEMAPKEKIREAIGELASKGGAYVIVSIKDDLSDTGLRSRQEAMKACLEKFGFEGQLEIDFYGCRQIADWIEQHPTVAIWVRSAIGRPIRCWRPFGPWAYQETDLSAEYVIDDRVKVYMPHNGNATDVSTAIKSLRLALGQNVSVRLVGLSGVGKTRLVQALFDARVCNEQQALDPESVIYADVSDELIPQPLGMLEALQAQASAAIVVVDNCAPDLHRRLTEVAKRPGSGLKLITVEYDIRDDLPEETECYRLDSSSVELVEQLLKRKSHLLSMPDIERIAQFSDGNARIAFALASTSTRGGDFARLRDEDLFKRLFHQKNTSSPDLLRSAEAASILYSFDTDMNAHMPEIGMLANLAECSETQFLRNVEELRKRGLVQQRGKWRAVLPHAIANRLASDFLSYTPAGPLIDQLLTRSTTRVAKSFSRRLGYLHESSCASEIVSALLAQEGLLGDLSILNETELAIFENVAPVNLESSLAALERAVVNTTGSPVESRLNYTIDRIARSIAYDEIYFDRAVQILLHLARNERQEANNKPALSSLKALFSACLSGTRTEPSQRALVLRRLFASSEKTDWEIGFTLLRAAFKVSQFMSSHSFEFGARKRDYGWWPRTRQDVHNWYLPFFELAVEIGSISDARSGRARAILGKSLPDLWKSAGLAQEILEATLNLKSVDGWPEGWLGAKKALQQCSNVDPNPLEKELRRLEQELAPRNLKEQIRSRIVVGPDHPLFDDIDDDASLQDGEPLSRYQRAIAALEALGRIAGAEFLEIVSLLPELLASSSHQKVFSFGSGVGEECADPSAFLTRTREILSAGQSITLNRMLVRGFLSGRNRKKSEDVREFLGQAVSDPVWGQWFPELQLSVPLDSCAFERLDRSLDLGIADVRQYSHLQFGRVTDGLSAEQLEILVSKVLSKPRGICVGLDILRMAIHCSKERPDVHRIDLGHSVARILDKMDFSAALQVFEDTKHELSEILEFFVASSAADVVKMAILRRMLESVRAQRMSLYAEVYRCIVPFLREYPIQTLDAVFVPDDDGDYDFAASILANWDDVRIEPALKGVPTEKLIEWCRRSPKQRFVFVARACHLFDGRLDEPAPLKIGDAAVRILGAAESKRDVLNVFVRRFFPSSWSGHRSQILRKRLPLFDQLNPGGDPLLQEAISKARNTFREAIFQEEKREQAEDRAQNERFE